MQSSKTMWLNKYKTILPPVERFEKAELGSGAGFQNMTAESWHSFLLSFPKHWSLVFGNVLGVSKKNTASRFLMLLASKDWYLSDSCWMGDELDLRIEVRGFIKHAVWRRYCAITLSVVWVEQRHYNKMSIVLQHLLHKIQELLL